MLSLMDLIKYNRIGIRCHGCHEIIEIKFPNHAIDTTLLFCPYCYAEIDLDPNEKCTTIS